MNYSISSDSEKLNIDFIWDYISNESYWAKGRSLEIVFKSIENSICFGAYLENGEQIGFARVVSDKAVFAWVMDVFVIDEFKGNGIGKALMESVLTHPELQNLSRWGLCTFDAHELYKKYGFKELERPEIHMELVTPK